MRRVIDVTTGQILTPEAVPAWLAHPANYGRVVTVLTVDTFSPTPVTGERGERPGGTPPASRATSN